MKRESIAGSSARVSRWRVVKQVLRFAKYEYRYADNTHLAPPLAAVGRTAVERRPYHRIYINAEVVCGRLKRRQDGGFPCGGPRGDRPAGRAGRVPLPWRRGGSPRPAMTVKDG